MRDIEFGDVFVISKIIKKMNIRNEIKDCVANAKKSENSALQNLNKINTNDNEDSGATKESEDVKKLKDSVAAGLGIDVALIFIENMSCAEKEFYTLFAGLTEKKVEEVRKIKLTELIKMIKELFTNNDMKEVFSAALNLKK